MVRKTQDTLQSRPEDVAGARKARNLRTFSRAAGPARETEVRRTVTRALLVSVKVRGKDQNEKVQRRLTMRYSSKEGDRGTFAL